MARDGRAPRVASALGPPLGPPLDDVRRCATVRDGLGSARAPEPDACPPILARLDEACRAVGRDPATIVRSAMIPWPQGSTDTRAARIAAYEVAGLERLYLNIGAGSVGSEAIATFGRDVMARRATRRAS